MKKIFFFPLLFFAIQISAQQPLVLEFKHDKDSILFLPMDKSKQHGMILKDSLEKLLKKSYSSNVGRLLSTQANGTRVYALRSDNMPCLVPDLSRYNYNMPNPAQGMKVTGIPPGSTPPNKVIPDN